MTIVVGKIITLLVHEDGVADFLLCAADNEISLWVWMVTKATEFHLVNVAVIDTDSPFGVVQAPLDEDKVGGILHWHGPNAGNRFNDLAVAIGPFKLFADVVIRFFVFFKHDDMGFKGFVNKSICIIL